MREFARHTSLGLALLAGAVLVWYLGRRLLDLTESLIDVVGPIWALIVVGLGTVVLTAVWIRHGGVGALGRWGVTIRPAHPLTPSPDDQEDERADADLPGTVGRRPGQGH